MTTTSASAASSVDSKPACSRSPAMRSESWKFIWQPKVSMRYLRATAPLRFGSKTKHFLRGGAETVGHHFASEHTSNLGHARVAVELGNARARAPAVDALFDRVVRVRVCRDLW